MDEKATEAGTERFRGKFEGQMAGHFRKTQDWWMSSIGLGTYLGEMDEDTDRRYTMAVQKAAQSGCNVIDTAINYRFQRSERNVGDGLKALIGRGEIKRDEIVVSSKGGFLGFDGSYPANPSRYFQQEYVEKGICTPEDIVANCHCMTPRYLENQLDRSLKNLGLQCIDIYLVHNPETQLAEVSRQDFLRRALQAFKMLEQKVAEGKIQIYGTATWDGYRVPPHARNYLSLEELIGLARNAGGDSHHFRAIQLPYNLAMPEAFVRKNQKLGSVSVSLLEAARAQGMVVLSSASILQGQLASNIPDSIKDVIRGFQTDAQASIQFARSTPGVSSALVGMSHEAHVAENLKTAQQPPLAWEKMKPLFED
jgi:aryl-alcohol dehydrogenase-like predicted oxidoreductase